jgi:non-homologous end joining protein Ku
MTATTPNQSRRKDVILDLGPMLGLTVSIYSATNDDDAADLHGICSGSGDTPHAPSRIQMRAECPVCNLTHRSHFAFPRGREVGDGWVTIPKDVLREANADGAVYNKRIGITIHDAAELASAFPTGKSYYLASADIGAYRTLVAVMNSRPDLAFVGRYAFMSTSVPHFYQLVPGREGVLILRQLAFPSAVLAAPEMDLDGDVDDKAIAIVNEFIDRVKVPFDPAAVTNNRRRIIQEYVDAQTPVTGAVVDTSAPAAATGGDFTARAAAALRALSTPTADADASAVPKRKARAPRKVAMAKVVDIAQAG